jgi:hypothetical protein
MLALPWARRAAAVTLAAGALLIAAPINAYDISLKGRVHERITRLAELCYKSGQEQGRCPNLTSAALKRTDWDEGEWHEAVRWPDDPAGQANLGGGIRFAADVLGDGCEKKLQPGKPYAGLLCNSHFGAYQFFHAMASTPNEPREQTRTLILAWSRVAFRIATGKIAAADDFCTTMRAQGEPMAGIFAPADFPYCSGAKAWKIQSLFTQRCGTSSTDCKFAPAAKAEALTRRNAVGALLHIIQDSYSRSHTLRDRTEAKDPYSPPMINCAPVQHFYLYTENKKDHGKADGLPDFATDCVATETILDPVTASARMLRFIETGDEEGLVAMLDREVLGPAPVSPGSH